MLICDTNIWYDLEEKPESVKNMGELTLTPLVIKEIANSPKLINKIDTVRKACENIFKFGNEIIIKTPLEYLLNLDNQEFEEKTQSEILSNEFEMMCRLKNGAKISIGKEDELKEKVVDIRSQISTGTANVQKMLDNVRLNKTNIKKTSVENTLELTKEVIKKVFIETPTDGKYKLSDNFDWSKVELFLYTFDAYINRLETNSNMKIKNNDWIDLFNLLYVTPNDKYLTDDRGIKESIRVAKMEKYLEENANS